MKTICGIDCSGCGRKETCKGCEETNGYPLGGECVAAECYKAGGENCFLAYKNQLIEEFNALGIADNHYLLVCEYGSNGAGPQIIIYKKR